MVMPVVFNPMPPVRLGRPLRAIWLPTTGLFPQSRQDCAMPGIIAWRADMTRALTGALTVADRLHPHIEKPVSRAKMAGCQNSPCRGTRRHPP